MSENLNINERNPASSSTLSLVNILRGSEDDHTIPYADSITESLNGDNSSLKISNNNNNLDDNFKPIPQQRKRKNGSIKITVEPVIHTQIQEENENNNVDDDNKSRNGLITESRSNVSSKSDLNNENPGPLPNVQNNTNINNNNNQFGLRRNSISLPMDLNKLEAIQQAAASAITTGDTSEDQSLTSSISVIIQPAITVSTLETESRTDSVVSV